MLGWKTDSFGSLDTPLAGPLLIVYARADGEAPTTIIIIQRTLQAGPSLYDDQSERF